VLLNRPTVRLNDQVV